MKIRGKSCILAGLFLLVISIAAYATVDTTKPWHPMQQIAIYGGSTTGIDNNNDMVIDIAEKCGKNGICEVKNTAGDAKIIINRTGGSYSSLDFFVNGIGRWGLGASGNNFYIDKTGSPPSAFFIDYATKNVGIGTTSPSQKLHVSGNARITGLANCNTIDTNANGDLVCGTDEGGSNYWALSGTNIYNTNTGNVGIGTTGPNKPLEISKTADANIRLTDSDGTNAAAYLEFYDASTRLGYIGLPGNAAEDLVIASESGKDIILSPAGNVGIGTTNPGAKLDIVGGQMRLSWDGTNFATFNQESGSSGRLGIYPGPGDNLILLGQPYTDPVRLTFTRFDGSSWHESYIGYFDSSNQLQLQSNTGPVIISGNARITGLVSCDTIDTDASGNLRCGSDASGAGGLWTDAGTYIYPNNYGSQFMISDTGLLDIRTAYGGPLVYAKEVGSGYANANAAIVADTDNADGTLNYAFQGRKQGSNTFSVRSDGQGYFAGNVGIGTTGPNARLSVVASGDYEISGTAMSSTFRTSSGSLGTTAGNELTLASIGFHSGNNEALGIRAYRTAAGSDWTTTAIGLGMDVDNSPRVNNAAIWLNSNGNVGIGTTNPGYKLDVNGNINMPGNTQFVFNNEPNGWYFKTRTTDATDMMGSNLKNMFVSGGSGTEGIAFKGASAYGFTYSAMEIQNNGQIYMRGNVGIGTTGPSTKLHLANGELGIGQQNDATAYLRMGMDSSYIQYLANNAYWTGSAYNYVTTWGYGGLASRISQYSGTINFDTASGGTNPITWTNRMSIANNGNVGIGTLSPVAKLHVSNSGMAIYGSSSTGQGVYADSSSGIGVQGYSFSTVQAGVHGANAGGVSGSLGYANAGVYGIGSSSNSGSWGVYCNAQLGRCGGTAGWTFTSDARLKENIRPIEGALEKVLELRGVSFERKDSPGRVELGFIAQEVLPVAPEIVSENPDGYYAITGEEFTPLLVEAIKEQQKEIEELRSEMEELKSRHD